DRQPERSAPAPAAQRPAPTEEPAAAPAAAAPAGAMDAAGLRRVWPEVMSAVREVNKPTHALLQNATVAAVEGTTVTLAMPTAPLARQLSQPNRASHVTAALGRVLSGEWAVRATDATGQAAGGSAPESDRGRAPQQSSPQAPPSRGTPAPPRGQQSRPSAPSSDGGRPPGDGGAPGGRPQFQRPSAAR
ncbi:DNA polymerase III subunit gamma/tau, partial [Actinomycetospora atypica]